MQYSMTGEPVQEPQTPMFNRQAQSRPFKWKQMLDFWCISDLKCSKTSKLVFKHACPASLFPDILHIPPSIIKASKWYTGNLKKMEAAWMIQTSSSYRGHSISSYFVDRWSHCVCAFITMIADQSTSCSTFYWTNEFDSSTSLSSVCSKYLSHSDRKGNSHASALFDALPRLLKQIPFLSTTNMWWKELHISKPQTCCLVSELGKGTKQNLQP